MNFLLKKCYENRIKKLDLFIASRGRLYLMMAPEPMKKNNEWINSYLETLKSEINSLNNQRNNLVSRLTGVQNAS